MFQPSKRPVLRKTQIQEQNNKPIQPLSNDLTLKITNKDIKYRLKHGQQFNDMLDPRDRVLQHEFDFTISFRLQDVAQKGFFQSQLYLNIMKNIHDFLTQAISNVVSISFNFFVKGLLKETQAKQYASKNMMINIQTVLGLAIIQIQQNQKLMQCILNYKQTRAIEANKKTQKNSFEESKICKKIMKEIKTEMSTDCDFIVAKILKNLAALYPMAPSAGSTPRMREIIYDVNRRDDQQNDFIYANNISIKQYIQIHSDTENQKKIIQQFANQKKISSMPVQIQKIHQKQNPFINEDYSGFIMQVINTAINVVQSNQNDRLQRTLTEVFMEFNKKLFWISKQKGVQNCFKNKQNKNIAVQKCMVNFFNQTLQRETQISDTINQQVKTYNFTNNIQKDSDHTKDIDVQVNKKQFISKISKGTAQQIQKLKNNCNFAIGQKIPSSVKPFSLQQIQKKQFAGKHSSLLRILTKWAEHLQKILQKPQIFLHNRSYPFKNIDGQLVYLKDSDQKKKLANRLSNQNQKVKNKFQILKRNCFQFIGQFASSKSDKENTNFSGTQQILSMINGMSSVNRFSKTRTFASKINAVLTQLTLNYTSILIHHLLVAGQGIKTDRHMFGYGDSLNLVSMNVTDLMRSKVMCKQHEFINLLKTVYFLDSCSEFKGKFKLVRIKNRLDTPANDIIINYLFEGKVQCEMQVSIQQPEDKQKKYYTFSHFVYQLTRGSFGTIAECAIMVSQLDNMIVSNKQGSYYEQLKQNKKKYTSAKLIKSENLKISKEKKIAYQCSCCKKLILKPNEGIFQNNQDQPQCIQCILKNDHPQSFIKNREIKQLLQQLVDKGKFQRIKNYNQLKNENQSFLIQLDVQKRRLAFSIAIRSQQQLKFFKIVLKNNDIKQIVNKNYNYNKLNYQNITGAIQKQKKCLDLIFRWHPQNQNFKLMSFMEFEYENGSLFKEAISSSLSHFWQFRRQKNIAKNIKNKPDIINFKQNPVIQKSLTNIFNALKTTQKASDDCQQLKYKKITKLDFGSIRKIQARNIQLIQKPVWLQSMENLQIINLESNNLKEFKLENLHNVSQLDLRYNEIQHVDFKKLSTCLVEIYLAKNKLQQIQLDSLPTSLQKFDLSYNKISHVNLANLPDSLKDLDLSFNKICQADLKKLPMSLQKLNLHKNKLSQVNLESLPDSLKDLDLSQNQLSFVNLTKLPSKLSILELGGNKIQTVQLNQLPQNLSKLNISFNKLSTIEISRIPANLQQLLLPSNPLIQINLSSPFVDSLQFNLVDIQNGNLRSLKNFSKLTRLEISSQNNQAKIVSNKQATILQIFFGRFQLKPKSRMNRPTQSELWGI